MRSSSASNIGLSRPEQGIALVQVLLITAIISVLLLVMVAYAQMHLRQATAVHEQLEERLELYSVATEIQYTLLTEGWGDTGSQTDNEWAQRWNFYNWPFMIDGYEVRIQNVGSLVSTTDQANMQALLVHFGVNTGRAATMARTLREWQRVSDFERQGLLLSERQTNAGRMPIQHVREIELLNGWNKDIVSAIEPYVTTINIGILNPAYLPSELLPIAVSGAQAQAIAQMREDGGYSRNAFSRLSGIEADEFMSLFPGPAFRIEITDRRRRDGIRLYLEATFEPYLRQPYSLRKIMYY